MRRMRVAFVVESREEREERREERGERREEGGERRGERDTDTQRH